MSPGRRSNRGMLMKKACFFFLCALLLLPVSVLLSQDKKNVTAGPDFVLLVTGETDGRVEPCG
jgi:hypothetical protein